LTYYDMSGGEKAVSSPRKSLGTQQCAVTVAFMQDQAHPKCDKAGALEVSFADCFLLLTA